MNNAGVNKRQPLDTLSTAAFKRILDCNLIGPAVLAQEAAVQMQRHGWGRIINVGSIMSHVGRTGQPAYCASKHALLGLTRSLAAELGCDGVTVNCVCPGYISTDLTAGLKADAGFDAAVQERNPLGRWGCVGEFQGVVAFLTITSTARASRSTAASPRLSTWAASTGARCKLAATACVRWWWGGVRGVLTCSV